MVCGDKSASRWVGVSLGSSKGSNSSSKGNGW